MHVSMMTKQMFEGRSLDWMLLVLLAAISALLTPEVQAALPAVAPPPAVAAGSTDWLAWIKASAKEGAIILGLLIGAVGLIMVVTKVIGQYSEVGNGRATWGDVAASATGGAVVMMLATAVLTLAIAVFP